MRLYKGKVISHDDLLLLDYTHTEGLNSYTKMVDNGEDSIIVEIELENGIITDLTIA